MTRTQIVSVEIKVTYFAVKLKLEAPMKAGDIHCCFGFGGKCLVVCGTSFFTRKVPDLALESACYVRLSLLLPIISINIILQTPDMKGLLMTLLENLVPLFTSTIHRSLLLSQSKVNDIILPSINDSQSYGYGASRETIDAWNNVKEGLDYLCERWRQAQQERWHPTNKIASDRPSEIVDELSDALRHEMEHIRALKETIEPTTVQIRQVIFDQYSTYTQTDCTESRAYNALLALHEYSKERGWATDEGYGKALGDGREKKVVHLALLYNQYFDTEEGKCVAKDTGTRIPHH